MIFDGNAVSEHKLRLQRVAVIRLVESFYAYFNTFGDFTCHNLGCVNLGKNSKVAGSFARIHIPSLPNPNFDAHTLKISVYENCSCKRRWNRPRNNGCRT